MPRIHCNSVQGVATRSILPLLKRDTCFVIMLMFVFAY